ncbi:hypothetical protein CO174_01795 [Candidatus Uhrbacteria bacterium CG_4_9_14_3_um_filter_50_9]|uniref:Rhodanese domain-containing protein n=1 Tax=Candidatus Uhrbacteria bacterium CG_4_9_14_3_um_filter_50_9 TaxID=1975035 RepID=A0A2M7XCU6_9BACT|nr:MAG: hypothetical protein CO174_01795 [Candidatus Uhrbacteria bacterium CG_4_9_14_3_um_filter_50_9]
MRYLIGIIILGLAVWGLMTLTNTPAIDSSATTTFLFEETEYDFGVLKQSSGISTHDFPFTYQGIETIHVTGLPTSCGCTSATINPSVLDPGTPGTITVSFNPNLHAEPVGHFYKTITLLTDPQLSDIPELKIWAEIDLDLGSEFFSQEIHEGEVLLQTENLAPEKDYRTISAVTLKDALDDKHFFLVDVHIPEQDHINGTDAVIAYDQIANHLDKLPSDKDEAIVLYCRSGSMSQQAAQTLADLGYTNVIHLEGGIQAFNQLY